MKVELARLNHVLVPGSFRNGRARRHGRLLLRLFSRLTREGRFLLLATTLGALFAVDVGRTESHLLVFAIGSLLFASMLFSPAYRLTGVTAGVRSPRRVTVGEEIAITLSLRNDSPREHRCIRVELPFLPWDGTWNGEGPTIGKLASGAVVRAVLRARFVARGEHHIDPVRAAALVPLWLAQGRALRTEGTRFVVVPKIARVTSIATSLNRRHQPGGVASAARTGEATDLLGVRPYRPGDPVRDLHARSWARHGSPMVREYQEEHLARIGIVVDSDVASASAEHLEAALSLTAGVVARLGRSDAQVDMIVVGDEPQHLASERNAGSLDQALDVLAAVQPSDGFAADRIFACLVEHLERLSSVVLVVLTWDPARARLAAAIRARGASCTVLVVGDRSIKEPHGTTVALGAIVRGESLSL